MRLTDQLIRNLPPPDRGQKTVWDTSLRGFGCRVSQGGTKSFVVQMGQERQLVTIGRYHHDVLPLAKARDEAKRILAENVLGKHRPKSIHWDGAKEAFLANCKTKNKTRTVYDYTRVLNRHFAFGKKQLGDIATSDIARRVERIKAPAERSYAIAIIKIFFNWAYRRGHLDASPAARLTKRPGRSREHVLTSQELGRVFALARNGTSTFDGIVCLLVLTGQRRSEIGSLCWEWIDFKEKLITLPSTATKNSREHCFPIGDIAIEVLKRIPQIAENPYVFPAAKNRYANRPATTFNGWAKPKARLDKDLADAGHAIRPWTLHDLRRTLRTNWAEMSVTREVAEKYINHVSGAHSGVNAVYERYSYMNEMREAVRKWEERVRLLAEKPAADDRVD